MRIYTYTFFTPWAWAFGFGVRRVLHSWWEAIVVVGPFTVKWVTDR